MKKNEKIILGILIAVGIILRWLCLTDRPFHHDESLYALYGYYEYSDPQFRYYQYLPLLHGPILFNLLTQVYHVFGSNFWAARMPMACLGSLFLFVPLLFRKYFSTPTLLLLTAYVALSPSLIYWSRFVGHDYLVFTAYLILLIGICLMDEKFSSFFVLLSIALQFCIKENAYVTSAIVLGYIVFEYFYKKFFPNGQSQTQSLASTIGSHFKKYPKPVLASLAFSICVYCYFYSAAFRYSKGILDGLYRESLAYWFNQHHVERIKGPFLFNFFFLSWYESIFVVALILYFLHFYYFTTKKIRLSAIATLILSAIFYIALKMPDRPLFLNTFQEFFKLKIPLDAWGPLFLIVHSFNCTIDHLRRGEDVLARWGYILFSFFFTYSFLGEKVPWLTLYILIPGIIYLTLYFENVFRKIPAPNLLKIPWWDHLLITSTCLCFVIALIVLIQGELIPALNWTFSTMVLMGLYAFNFKSSFLENISFYKILLICMSLYLLRISIITNFSRAGQETEFISQVHTTPDFQNLSLKIREQILNPIQGTRPRVMVIYDSIWPMAWYLRDLPDQSYRLFPSEKYYFDHVFTQSVSDPELLKTHNVLAIPLRGWWVPDYENMGLHQFLSYAFHHEPWNKPGFLFVTYAAKKMSISQLSIGGR